MTKPFTNLFTIKNSDGELKFPRCELDTVIAVKEFLAKNRLNRLSRPTALHNAGLVRDWNKIVKSANQFIGSKYTFNSFLDDFSGVFQEPGYKKITAFHEDAMKWVFSIHQMKYFSFDAIFLDAVYFYEKNRPPFGSKMRLPMRTAEDFVSSGVYDDSIGFMAFKCREKFQHSQPIGPGPVSVQEASFINPHPVMDEELLFIFKNHQRARGLDYAFGHSAEFYVLSDEPLTEFDLYEIALAPPAVGNSRLLNILIAAPAAVNEEERKQEILKFLIFDEAVASFIRPSYMRDFSRENKAFTPESVLFESCKTETRGRE